MATEEEVFGKEEAGEGEENQARTEEDELEEMKQKMKQMEEESTKLKEMHAKVDADTASVADKEELDSRSIYVGQVDYSATPEELQAHFQSCGSILRITILVDKFTGKPKGFAYVEFGEKEAVANALVLNDSVFKGRNLKVTAKRTNQPWFMLQQQQQPGGGRGRGGFRGRGGSPYGGGFRGRGAPFRGRGARGRGGYYSPY